MDDAAQPEKRRGSESASIDQALAGDREALGRLLALHLPALESYLRFRRGEFAGPDESLADLAQSTCREVLQNLDRFRHGGDRHFRAWLFEMAERKLHNRRRHILAGKRDRRRLEAWDDDSEESTQRYLAAFHGERSPSSHADARERLGALIASLAELEEDKRRLILLARVAKIPHGELARRSDISEATLRQRLHRALAELAEQMCDSGHAPDELR